MASDGRDLILALNQYSLIFSFALVCIIICSLCMILLKVIMSKRRRILEE